MDALERQRTLIDALLDPRRYPHAPERVEHRETHISHVLLAGDLAYKIKKPLDLGFLDFTELADRARFCAEEVRLNARLAPDIYLDRVAITGTPADPCLDGEGEPIEYAVRMRRFDESALLARLLEAGRVDTRMARRLGRTVGAFHEAADARVPEPHLGRFEAIIEPMRQNFAQTGPRVDEARRARIAALARWTEAHAAVLRPRLAARRRGSRVRECHGDLHADNIVVTGDGPMAFDGIEFNPSMRWIDVAADVAFLVMDLDARDAPGLAGAVLDEWLATTGDVDALAAMRLYLAYRAMVRAKIAAIRLEQLGSAGDGGAERATLDRYLALAQRYSAAHAPALVLTHGVAGSGKSTAAGELVERIGAVRLRADSVRLRLFGDRPRAERYARAASDAVYARLREDAAVALEAGFPVVVDATFLEGARRAPFLRLARDLRVPLRILVLELPEETLAERIRAREAAGDDPSEADTRVMREQLAQREPPDADEAALCLACDASGAGPIVPATGLAHARGRGADTPT